MSPSPQLFPADEYNRTLLSFTHPAGRINPEPAPMYNLVVVGAGTAGLIAAIGGATVGARVALVEKDLTGGDCLNFGCVPSKAVIRSSRSAFEFRQAQRSGHGGERLPGDLDFPLVMERMRRIRARISQNDSVERLESFGIDVFLGTGRFTARTALEVEGRILNFKKAVIATGAKPAHPEFEGIREVGFLTNETVFSLTELPGHLVVIGGGPIGCELAQAFRRLGSQVTIVQRNPQFLPREDRDAAEVLGQAFSEEGIVCKMNMEPRKASLRQGRKVLVLTGPGGEESLEADEILVGIGRKPNVEDLNLEAAGVNFDAAKGVLVNDYLQTTNRRIYAAGDVCYPYKFTHMAAATARIVVQNALFIRSKKHRSLIVPWCTYTDPEIAHVGLSEKEALARGITLETYFKSFKDVDRAVLDGEEEGFIKIHTRKGKNKILGATLVARHAGEMISQLTLAMSAGAGLKTLAGMIYPYPTQAEAIQKAAVEYYQRKFSPSLKKILERWFGWRR